jgi:hypothetical protein
MCGAGSLTVRNIPGNADESMTGSRSIVPIDVEFNQGVGTVGGIEGARFYLGVCGAGLHTLPRGLWCHRDPDREREKDRTRFE